MKIVENRGIKNSEAMEFVLLKWSIFWSIIWGKPSINGIKMGKMGTSDQYKVFDSILE